MHRSRCQDHRRVPLLHAEVLWKTSTSGSTSLQQLTKMPRRQCREKQESFVGRKVCSREGLNKECALTQCTCR
ncbi:hypothetical protein PhCBS80983_g02857 [Powellomyces hirtus]|uniref:Uncharacterized protein n=1 Tax=Powellomyces hirtus TaxID=109895 RepID=A0A507E4V9_9FUNG|nr:hypothetical protein PhCBS80983_g02857 [Powellomyces hirtus]